MKFNYVHRTIFKLFLSKKIQLVSGDDVLANSIRQCVQNKFN